MARSGPMGGAMKPVQMLYLLASDHGFRLVENHEHGLREVKAAKAGDFSDVTFHFTSQRSTSHGGGAGFAVDGPADKTEEERSRLAEHAVAALRAEWARGVHDRIVLVAGPKMLGALRHALPAPLEGKVAGSLHKDLMKVPLHDLPGHFSDISAV